MDISDSDIYLNDRSVEIKQKIYAFFTLTIPFLTSIIVFINLSNYTQYLVMDVVLFNFDASIIQINIAIANIHITTFRLISV